MGVEGKESLEKENGIQLSVERNIVTLCVKDSPEEAASEAWACLQQIDPLQRIPVYSPDHQLPTDLLAGRNTVTFKRAHAVEETAADLLGKWVQSFTALNADAFVAVNPDLTALAVLCEAAANYGVPVAFYLSDTSVFDQLLEIEKWFYMHPSVWYVKQLFDLVGEEDRLL